MLEDEARKLPPEEEVNWCRLPSVSFAFCMPLRACRAPLLDIDGRPW